MTNLYKHYKDCSPADTINTIDTFFKNNNCLLEIVKEQNNYNLYSCSCILKYKNDIILESNGKGVDILYARASAYGEMYERFCLIATHFNFNFFNSLYINENINKPLLTIDNDNYLKNFFKIKALSIKDNTIDKDNFIKQIFFNDKILGYEYINLLTKEKSYFNSQAITYFMGSNGAAAGNTLEEALVQATSELLERYAISLFINNETSTYFYLNINNLNKNIQQIINNIKSNLNCEIYIYDLSYTFNIPVCLVILKNYDTHNIYLSFGSHPNITIAIERCLTELFQCHITLPIKRFIIPKDNIFKNQWVYQTFLKLHNNIELFPEIIINNNKEIQTYNNKIFLDDKEYNNFELLQYNLEIYKKNNIDLYYRNLSLCNDLYAVQVITDPILNNEFILYKEKQTQETYITKNDLINIITFLKNKNFQNLKIFQNMNIQMYLEFNVFEPFDFKNSTQFISIIIFQRILNNNFTSIKTEELNKLNNILYELFQRFILKDYNNLTKYLGYTSSITENEISAYLKILYNSNEYKEFLNIFKKTLL